MKCFSVLFLSLVSTALAATIVERGESAKRQGPIITAPLIDAYLNDAAGQSQPYEQAIVTTLRNNLSTKAQVESDVRTNLPKITQIFNTLANNLSRVAQGNKPNATEVQDGYQAFMRVFAQVDLAIYDSEFESALVSDLSALLVAYCQATKKVLLELQSHLTGAAALGNQLAGSDGLTPAILDAIDLTCLDGVLVPCEFGPIRVGVPQCPCPPGRICPL